MTLKFQSLAFQKTTVAATKKIVADWNAANPNIQVEYVQGSWDSVHDQLVTQAQSVPVAYLNTLVADTDGDSFANVDEVAMGTDPQQSASQPATAASSSVVSYQNNHP